MDLAEFLGSPIREEGQVAPLALLSEYIEHLSASSIGMLVRCEEQFRQRYILGKKERPGESIVVGSFFHETLQWNYATKVASHRDQPLSDAVQYLQDVAVPKVLEENGGEDEIRWDTSLDKARLDGERVMSAYYQQVVPTIQPIEVEQRFELQIPGAPVPLIGYIDVKAGHFMEMDTETLLIPDRVIDTKSGKSVSRKVKPSWRLQGNLYSLATSLPVEFHSISRAATPTICTGLDSEAMIVPVPTTQQVASIAMNVVTAAERIEWLLQRFGPFETWPTTGSIPDFTRNMLPCDFCGWRKDCPAWAGAV